MVNVYDPQTLPLVDLIQKSTEYADSYRATGIESAGSRYCYELFRRAVVEKNEFAWHAIYQLYEGQMLRWIRQCSSYRATEQDAVAMVGVALSKFWRAVAPEQFAYKLTSLGAALSYLKRCSQTVVIDEARAKQREQRLESLDSLELGRWISADSRPIEDLTSALQMESQLMHQIDRLVSTRQERCILVQSIFMNKKSRQIFLDNGNLFDDIQDVYRAKENLMKRLRRNPTLHALRYPEAVLSL